ncbi:MAG TPA: carbohydrate ABC transporter substrate-binding protein [Lachnospiraceae bacterium]|nr:carbohydrate ABC transporter substrate-binding protein [Lachnospiraceae bacterium]
MKKKLLATMLVTAMAVSATACGGGGSDAPASSDGEGGGSSGGSGTAITIFNSKSEIQDQFVQMAEKYSAEKGVDVEVYYSNDTVAAHLATRYSANDPYTLSMVDAKDIYSLGPEHAIDLSDQEWVQNTDYAISVDGKVMGFPVCIEARGLMYNATAIEAITGEEFKPEDYATVDAFQGLLDKLVAGGMETPTGIMKEDWSLAGHFLSETYEEQPDVEAYITQLHEGTADLINNEKFNAKMDYFDTMMKYNFAAGSAIATEREVAEQKLAEGEIAFMFGGNWDWSMLSAYDYSEKMGMMAVPQNTSDGTNAKMEGGGSKYFFIDSSESTSEEQRQAAKDFLNWLVLDEEGNKFLTEDCNLVPAYSNISAEALDPLSTSVKEFADAGNLIPNYDYLPDDHYSICGASMQKYLAGQIDRAGLATEIENYWKSTAPVEH